MAWIAGTGQAPGLGESTASRAGTFDLFAVLGGLADVERDLIRTRTAEGRSRAQKHRQHMGRPSKLTDAQKAEARRRAQGATLAELARSYDVGEKHYFATDRRMLAVLGAFFDDSGTHASSLAVVIGGLLGTDEQWDAFETAWTARLARPLPGKPPLNQFHLSLCRAKRGEFRDYNQAEIDSITYLFRRIILDLGFVTLAVAVNRSAWNELVVGTVEDELGQPEGLCFFKCIELVINTIRIPQTRGAGVYLFRSGDEGPTGRMGEALPRTVSTIPRNCRYQLCPGTKGRGFAGGRYDRDRNLSVRTGMAKGRRKRQSKRSF